MWMFTVPTGATSMEGIKEYYTLSDGSRLPKLGVSNFLPHHLDNILKNCRNCRIRPLVDQLELHPGYSQEGALAYCKANDILPMAWSPLGRGRENATAGRSRD